MKTQRIRYRGTLHPFVSTRSFGTLQTTKKDYLLTRSPSSPLWSQHGARVREHSTMRDFVSDHYDLGNRPVNEVDHVFLSKAFSGPRLHKTYHSWYPYNGITEWTFSDGCFRQLIAPSYFNTKLPLPPSTFLADHSNTAIGSMTHQFPTEISAINALIELKDIPELLDTVREVKDLLQFLGAGGGINFGSKRRPPSIGQASAIHMQYNFGVSPLIGDIKTIANIFQLVDARLAHLKRTFGKYARVGHTSHWESDTTTRIESFGSAIAGEEMYLDVVRARSTVTSTAQVRNNLAWVDSWEGIVRGFIGTLGLDNPALIAYEAMKFSWLVDYFLPVGDIIQNWKFQDLTGWIVRRFTTSIKTDYDVVVSVKARGALFPEVLGVFTITRYTRNIGFPSQFGGISSPNAKQLSILAALTIGHN